MSSKIFVMRGVSCCGKSTYVRKELGFDEHDILSSDFFRGLLFSDQSFQRRNDLVFKTLHKILDERLHHHVFNTVMDAMHLSISDTKTIRELAERHNAYVNVISIIPPSFDVLKQRHAERKEKGLVWVPDEIIQKMIDRYNNCNESFIKMAREQQNFSFVEVNYE